MDEDKLTSIVDLSGGILHQQCKPENSIEATDAVITNQSPSVLLVPQSHELAATMTSTDSQPEVDDTGFPGRDKGKIFTELIHNFLWMAKMKMFV